MKPAILSLFSGVIRPGIRTDIVHEARMLADIQLIFKMPPKNRSRTIKARSKSPLWKY